MIKRLRIITCTLDEYGNIKKRVVKNVRKRTRPRKSRDRRLLEALLGSEYIFTRIRMCAGSECVTSSVYKQLLAIKQSAAKKGGK